jgi:hypothetical protein
MNDTNRPLEIARKLTQRMRRELLRCERTSGMCAADAVGPLHKLGLIENPYQGRCVKNSNLRTDLGNTVRELLVREGLVLTDVENRSYEEHLRIAKEKKAEISAMTREELVPVAMADRVAYFNEALERTARDVELLPTEHLRFEREAWELRKLDLCPNMPMNTAKRTIEFLGKHVLLFVDTPGDADGGWYDLYDALDDLETAMALGHSVLLCDEGLTYHAIDLRTGEAAVGFGHPTLGLFEARGASLSLARERNECVYLSAKKAARGDD